MTAQQLKASILQLAIQGKLVPQNPEDEPASVLLKKIKAEKDALVKAGTIKKDKHESVIVRNEDGRYLEKKDGKTTDITNEIPFDIPESWEWARLKTLLLQASTGPFGSMLHQSDYVEEGTPLVNPADIINATISDIKIKKVSSSTVERLATYKLSSKDVVIGRRGEMGRSAVVTNRENGWLCGTGCFFVTPSSGLLPDYLVFLLSTPYIKESLLSKSVGTTMNNLNHGILGHLLIPFPPKTEQKRILAKIEELLPHVEEYGKAETDISKLNAELPEQLKKSILQWAIQGRLVPQDPTDEPASELLKRIKAEKAALIKSGKLKKEKPLPPISEDEIPFEIPDSWQWVRLGDIGTWKAGATPSRQEPTYYNGGTIPWLKTGDLNDGYITNVPEFITEKALAETSVHLNPVGSVLIAMYGATIGKLGILQIEATTNQACCACQPFPQILNTYLFFFLLSQRKNFSALGAGGAQPNISREKIINCLFPLPPLAEQKRITKKLETILSIIQYFCLK